MSKIMSDIKFSVELVREFLRDGGDHQERRQAMAAFEVVMETCEAMGVTLEAILEAQSRQVSLPDYSPQSLLWFPRPYQSRVS